MEVVLILWGFGGDSFLFVFYKYIGAGMQEQFEFLKFLSVFRCLNF